MFAVFSGLRREIAQEAYLSWMRMTKDAARFAEVFRTAFNITNDAKSDRLNSMHLQIFFVGFACQCKFAIVFGTMKTDTAIAACRKFFCKDSKVRNRLALRI